jgi:hypothetical protein
MRRVARIMARAKNAKKPSFDDLKKTTDKKPPTEYTQRMDAVTIYNEKWS